MSGGLAIPGFREALDRDSAEAFRQGARGPAHDLTLEARPWGVPLERIEVPIEIWHGEDDRVVSPEQGRILARTRCEREDWSGREELRRHV